jgi:N-carbamoylputrescine amidase
MVAESKRQITIGCAQMECFLGKPEKNLEAHIHFMKIARERKCDLLVFPELSMTGYDMSSFGRGLAMPVDSPVFQALSHECGSTLSVIVGFVEDGPCGLVYNSVALVNQSGVIFVHRKMSLANFGQWDEGKYYAEGRRLNVCRFTREWTVASLICQDVWQPALIQIAAMKGATLFVSPFCSALWRKDMKNDGSAGWDIASKYIAIVYGMPVVLCNRAGTEGQYKFWGGSRILDPYGRILSQAGAGEEFIAARLDYADVENARYSHPIVRDCRIDTVLRELTRAAAGDFGEQDPVALTNDCRTKKQEQAFFEQQRRDSNVSALTSTPPDKIKPVTLQENITKRRETCTE